MIDGVQLKILLLNYRAKKRSMTTSLIMRILILELCFTFTNYLIGIHVHSLWFLSLASSFSLPFSQISKLYLINLVVYLYHNQLIKCMRYTIIDSDNVMIYLYHQSIII